MVQRYSAGMRQEAAANNSDGDPGRMSAGNDEH